MKIVIVGATGLVGLEILKVLEEKKIEIKEIIPVASKKSIGKFLNFKGKNYKIVDYKTAIKSNPNVAIFSAGKDVSLKIAPKFAEAGITVIDNSSAWRMDPNKKLIVPEINAHILSKKDKIIANPNCSTIQMVIVLKPLHDKYKIKRVVVSTYQSVTGTGKLAVDQLMNERKGNDINIKKAYPYPIDLNVIPHIDVFMDNGYTKEEMKMIQESNKILNDFSIGITATAVRIPTIGGHAESVNIEFENDFNLIDIYSILKNFNKTIIIEDDPKINLYPMPINAHKKNQVFVGRIRKDESQKNTINVWIVADNLRKGAATNAVQIVEYLINKEML